MSTAPDTPEMKAVAAFLAASFDSKMSGANMREAMIWSLGPAALAAQPGAEPAKNNDVDQLLRAVFELCEATEEAPEVAPKNEHQRGFERGRRFEAKAIRRAVGDWFQATFCGRSFMGEPVIAAAPTEAKPAQDAVDAWRDVLAERERQKSAEGYTPEHDNSHRHGDMSTAAACYAMMGRYHYPAAGHPPPQWPWDPDSWKPTNYRRNLVKAGALILAEIERLDRAAISAKKGGV